MSPSDLRSEPASDHPSLSMGLTSNEERDRSSASAPVSVSFVIPVRNDAVRLRRCLQAIVRSAADVRIEPIVVDNGSTDDTAAVARESGARVIELPGLKVAALRNHGALLASAPILAFVDADHEIAPGWIPAALETMQQSGVGAAGAEYSSPDTPTWVQRVYDAFRRHLPGLTDVEWLGAGNLVVRSDVFARVGGFDNALEACEDVDFCQRLRSADYRIVSDSRLRSVHYGDPSSLKALLVSEMWRGRDNLRISLRGPFTLRELPSVVIPVVGVLSMAVALVGILLLDARAVFVAALAFLALAALRGVALFRRLRAATPLDLLRAFAVACVYDLGRSLALVARAPHRRARGAKSITSS
jgi:GT2 family glycosyltransferase